ncbi:DnaJ-related protein scj1 [Balamuthia mandrillaris]
MSRSPHRSTGPSSSVLLCCVSVALFCFSLCLLVERCAAAASGGGEDYYKLLGVTRDATEAKIKSAYKKLAAKWHPDKYKGEDKEKAVKEFQKVSKAYEVLKDEQKRRIYDQYGEEGLEQQGRRGGGGGFTDPFDLFSNFGFSTGGKRRGGGAVQERQAPPLVLELEVTLEDLYLGRVLTVTHKKQTLCPSCRGTGAKDPDDVKTCPVCHGSGMVITTHQIGPGFVTQTQSICNKCGGKGKIVKSVCPVCGGTKVGVGEETITVVVERGMSDGQKITFKEEGPEAPDVIPGDLIFQLVTIPHKQFRRKGNDLHLKASISLLESLVGFSSVIKHLDGHDVVLERDTVTKPGHVMIIKGEGMPVHEYPSQRGDLHVEFGVRFPESLTPEQIQGFKELLKNNKD